MADETVIVSVCMITYNHEKYIAQAIDGVLMQQTNFLFELVIGEDCSTDCTRKICIEYKKKYKEKIHLLLPDSNIGPRVNFLTTSRACNGKYIALCEGDDYWTDPYKLQKQVDFLEANESYAICFHPVKIWKVGEIIDDYITRQVPETTTILDLAEGNYIHTPSVVFRKNELVFVELDKINEPIGDYVLHMLNAKYGKIKKLSDSMAVYRVHSGGVHSLISQQQKTIAWVLMLDKLILYFDAEVSSVLEETFFDMIDVALANSSYLNELEKIRLLKRLNDKPNYIYEKFEEFAKHKLELEQLKANLHSIKFILKKLLKNLSKII